MRSYGISFSDIFFFKDFIYLSHTHTHTEAEGEAGSMQGARRGTPGSCPGPKAGPKPLSPPAALSFSDLMSLCVVHSSAIHVPNGEISFLDNVTV